MCSDELRCAGGAGGEQDPLGRALRRRGTRRADSSRGCTVIGDVQTDLRLARAVRIAHAGIGCRRRGSRPAGAARRGPAGTAPCAALRRRARSSRAPRSADPSSRSSTLRPRSSSSRPPRLEPCARSASATTARAPCRLPCGTPLALIDSQSERSSLGKVFVQPYEVAEGHRETPALRRS